MAAIAATLFAHKYWVNYIHLTEKDFKLLWRNLKHSAEKRGIEFDLDIADLEIIGIPITCPILGIPLHFHTGKVQDDSISFDRIDPTNGYKVDNLIVISYRANKLKSDASLEELQKICNFYVELNKNRNANLNI